MWKLIQYIRYPGRAENRATSDVKDVDCILAECCLELCMLWVLDCRGVKIKPTHTGVVCAYHRVCELWNLSGI